MKVLSYSYITPNKEGIVEDLDRNDYMTTQYIDMSREYLDTIELRGKVAFLYAGGVLLTASEVRNSPKEYREKNKPEGLAIKDLAAYSMHKWIGVLNGRELIRYANVNGNTCASSMYCLYEAEQLLNNGFDQVIIVAEEKTSNNTQRVFSEMNIDIKIGEGCAIIHLGKASNPADEDITNCKVWYEYNRNPFGVTESGYTKVMSDTDIIKPHGTGTDNNETAESKVYGNTPQLRYKEQYGHTQGTSGLIEVCSVLDECITDMDILCVSSGMGGFYASCVIHM